MGNNHRSETVSHGYDTTDITITRPQRESCIIIGPQGEPILEDRTHYTDQQSNSYGASNRGRYFLRVGEKAQQYLAGWVDFNTPYFCTKEQFAKQYLYGTTRQWDLERLEKLGYKVWTV